MEELAWTAHQRRHHRHGLSGNLGHDGRGYRRKPDDSSHAGDGLLGGDRSQSQAVAVRRLVDSHSNVISLVRLLDSIAANPQLITREWWIDQHDPLDHRIAAQEWDANFGGTVHDHVDPQIVASDTLALLAEADRVKTLVNKVVGHHEENYSGPIVTQGDINGALDHIGRLFQKYYKLVLVADWYRLIPHGIERVMATFSVPWVPAPE